MSYYSFRAFAIVVTQPYFSSLTSSPFRASGREKMKNIIYYYLYVYATHLYLL
jgi:hypothetical protein